MNGKAIHLFWFRRDLRLDDNHGLFRALEKDPVLPIFIFDPNILNRQHHVEDPRIIFIYRAVLAVKKELESHGGSMLVFHGNPLEVFRRVMRHWRVLSLSYNRDYEPAARERDNEVEGLFRDSRIPVFSFRDQVVFEKDQVVKKDDRPYSVFSAYAREWQKRWRKEPATIVNSRGRLKGLYRTPPLPEISLETLGFRDMGPRFPEARIREERIRDYHRNRDYPAREGTTRLGVHLRFGTIGIRSLVHKAVEWNPVFLRELIWREFYMMILWHHPRVVKRSFHAWGDRIRWRKDPEDFESWCRGKTGYPLVDAGMRELSQTGYMHNRCRMVTAGFLTRHLLVDWRWGEAWFARKLLDYELSSNNGGWQWAAGTGCDGVPYFRIFNPLRQQKRFDPEMEYIRRWIPELGSPDYPSPMVEHVSARDRALAAYRRALGKE